MADSGIGPYFPVQRWSVRLLCKVRYLTLHESRWSFVFSERLVPSEPANASQTPKRWCVFPAQRLSCRRANPFSVSLHVSFKGVVWVYVLIINWRVLFLVLHVQKEARCWPNGTVFQYPHLTYTSHDFQCRRRHRRLFTSGCSEYNSRWDAGIMGFWCVFLLRWYVICFQNWKSWLNLLQNWHRWMAVCCGNLWLDSQCFNNFLAFSELSAKLGQRDKTKMYCGVTGHAC